MKNNLIMLKKILISLSILMMLSSQVCLAKGEKNSVFISPEVQVQIQKYSPGERKKMEAAISVGNKFIPHHFNGRAYARNDEQEPKYWLKNIRPLVNRDDADWYVGDDVFAEAAPALVINDKYVKHEVVCPKPELISANTVGDQYQLKYRTKIIGMWKSNSILHPIQGDILLNEKNEFDEVLLTLDQNYRVSQVASKYAVFPTIPQQGIHLFEAYIKWPPRAIFQSATGADQETESEARAKIPQYKQYIDLIKREEAAACKGALADIKQSIGRE
jgi:hypothetical protein